MKDKIFGFAIIGCGAIARIHAEAIASLEDARLTAVFDQNTAHAAAFAREFGCHALQLRDLLDAIREDRPSAVDATEGRKAVDIILTAYRSSQTGQKQFLRG